MIADRSSGNERLVLLMSRAGIIGSSARMIEICSIVELIAPTSATVLISGESGTGKEMIARAIHANSDRVGKFVSINCGALPETLLESELFGHERGAFTGAIRNKRGLFQEAHGGTIFLDEISETSTAMQVKLLRVLQDGSVRKVGSNVETTVDVRVIAATNRDLSDSIREGTFRRDLFYRINVIPIALPPLRQRREDIPMLAQHFIEKYCTRMEVQPKSITPDAMCAIEKYFWPGNVRELENSIERMVALNLCADDLTRASLSPHILDVNPPTFDVSAVARAQAPALWESLRPIVEELLAKYRRQLDGREENWDLLASAARCLALIMASRVCMHRDRGVPRTEVRKEMIWGSPLRVHEKWLLNDVVAVATASVMRWEQDEFGGQGRVEIEEYSTNPMGKGVGKLPERQRIIVSLLARWHQEDVSVLDPKQAKNRS